MASNISSSSSVIDGSLSSVVGITANINVNVDIIDGNITIGGVPSYQTYTGDYQVTPRLYDQSLDTDNKLMSDDVTVYQIPVTYTSNIEGGKTVLIG